MPGTNQISRRTFTGLAIAGTLAIVSGAATFIHEGAAQNATVPMDELMADGSLPDVALGSKDAPVTIVEYASMTCTHCAAFHAQTYPTLKSKYIDSGKVRFILREFPLDPLATAAFMLARCAGPSRRDALLDRLFDNQADWAFVKENPTPKLFEVAKQAGFTQESFDKCLTDQKLLDQLTAIRSRADDVFGISSTPTFFINGKRLQVSPTVEEFDKVLGPLLAQG